MMPIAHMEYALLRSCFSLSKTTYLLRTIPSSLSATTYWRNFDYIMRDTLCQILSANLQDIDWEQAQLPVFMGRVGLRSTDKHAAAAYLALFKESEGKKSTSFFPQPALDATLEIFSRNIELDKPLLGHRWNSASG